MATFQLLSDEAVQRYGYDVVANEAGIQPGLLVNFDAQGDGVTKGEAATRPDGFAFGNRVYTYHPTSRVFASGEKLVVLMGAGQALASSDFFSSGSLPSAGDDLYSAADGKMATSGTHKIGSVIRTKTWYEGTAGTGDAKNAAVFRFNFDALS